MSHPSTGAAEPRPTEEFFKSLTGNGAIFSPSRKYRYALWRSWDEGKGRVLFVMLNPSIADETKDDPTQRRCRRFAKDWGYAGYMVANLYAYISTDPRNLWRPKLIGIIGPENEAYLKAMHAASNATIIAWGNGDRNNRGDAVLRMLEVIGPVQSIGFNKDHSPKHPLYVRADAPRLSA